MQLTGLLATGQHELISGHLGEALQLRPKAATSKCRTRSVGSDGEPTDVLPLGFYLRARFTETILWNDR